VIKMMDHEHIVSLYRSDKHLYERFLNSVYNFFSINPALNSGDLPIIHSMKMRLKDENHLIDKINRKHSTSNPITADNLFERVTDLAGLRVLYLYQNQFAKIHNQIMKQIHDEEWAFYEQPKAFTWDPEVQEFYESLDISCELKETHYTSVHYVVKPRASSTLSCEIQVRSLYEEIWGEIDHFLNYPYPTASIACKEQLRVLSKLTSTGTRFVNSIFNSIEEYNHLYEVSRDSGLCYTKEADISSEKSGGASITD